MQNQRSCDPFFAKALVQWQIVHGRHDLPWQKTKDPYRVWLSEIMLQQTQVATVQGFFARFLMRFPDIRSLAFASLDDVLALWAGLGYYSRAKNLHRCAQQLVSQHDGKFPRTAQELELLPGIGRSTAAAIASLCFAQRVAILDGNAKRVVARYLGFVGDLAQTTQLQSLWNQATLLLPVENTEETMPIYTQALMDLGAGICTRQRPLCAVCPLLTHCQAYVVGAPERFPLRTRKLRRTAQSVWLLWAVANDGSVWLQQRPSPGIWAGLYCLPWFEDSAALRASLQGREDWNVSEVTAVKHALTHKDLYLYPVRICLPKPIALGTDGAWFSKDKLSRIGLPAPVKKLLFAF